MCWLLRCGHAARQALQVALHTGRPALELREVFFGQTIEPERADLVTKLLGHRVLSLAFCRFRAAASAGQKLASLICQDRACPIRRDRRLRRAAPDRPGLVFLPPYSPELNPIERLRLHLRDN